MNERGVARDAILLALVLGSAVVAYRPLLDLGHLGWDTYPLIATSRVESAADLPGLIREELMDGRYPHGRFYRPLTTLSIALDHALWGLDAFGYHLTQLVLLLACALAVAALARRLLGPGVGPLVAALVFALHPLQVETLPVVSRRAESFALLFSLLALVCAPRAGVRGAGVRLALCSLCAVLAVASKEPGVIVVPLLLTLWFCEAGAASAGERLRVALRASAWPAVAVGLYLLARTAVLGGLGGHAETSLIAGAARGLALAPLYARLLLMPQPLAPSPALVVLAVAVSAAALAAALAFAARRPPARRLLAVCGVWIAGMLWLNGVAGEVASWYALSLLPAFALLVGIVAEAGAERWQAGSRAAGASLALVAALLGCESLRFSPLLHSYDAWSRVSQRSQAFLERVRLAAESAGAGDVRSVPGIPLGSATPLERVGVRSALGLAGYSVEAWAELALPGAKLAVVVGDGTRASSPRADAIVIDTSPDLTADSLR